MELLLTILDLSDLYRFILTAHVSSTCFSATALTPAQKFHAWLATQMMKQVTHREWGRETMLDFREVGKY